METNISEIEDFFQDLSFQTVAPSFEDIKCVSSIKDAFKDPKHNLINKDRPQLRFPFYFAILA